MAWHLPTGGDSSSAWARRRRPWRRSAPAPSAVRPGWRSRRSGRCRSARSVLQAGSRVSCVSRPTASAATSTSSGPMSARASGSAAPPKAGSALRTGWTASSRSRWLLDDRPLQSRIDRYIDYIVTHQRPDGWYSPYPEDAVTAPLRHVGHPARQQSARPVRTRARGDDRILKAVMKSLRAMMDGLDRTPLYDWGRYRWFEGLIPVFYCYEKTGRALAPRPRPQAARPGLRLPGVLPGRGCHGADAAPRALEMGEARRQHGHGPEGLRPGLAPRSARGRPEIRGAHDRDPRPVSRPGHRHVHWRRVPLPERTRCRGPSSAPWWSSCSRWKSCFRSFGDPAFGDRLERVAFNALPATFTPDMWAHQYDQQVNQVQCTINPEHMWSTNGPDSNLYGLEPNYGCCTSNMHQGWPKFASHLWMKTPDDGIAAVAYAPSRAEF